MTEKRLVLIADRLPTAYTERRQPACSALGSVDVSIVTVFRYPGCS